MPQPNGSTYVFARDINVLWRHGILQAPPDKRRNQGRISVIAWGWTDQTEAWRICNAALCAFVKCSVADPDPGSGAFFTPGSGIRDPGSGWTEIRIRDKHPGSTELVKCVHKAAIICNASLRAFFRNFIERICALLLFFFCTSCWQVNWNSHCRHRIVVFLVNLWFQISKNQIFLRIEKFISSLVPPYDDCEYYACCYVDFRKT